MIYIEIYISVDYLIYDLNLKKKLYIKLGIFF